MKVLRPWLLALVGIIVGVLLVGTLADESPLTLIRILTKSAFGSQYDLGMTLFYATPLIFTGLAVSIPLQAGLFNIGAEGQLLMGALFATITGIVLKDWDAEWMTIVCALAAMIGGGLWGWIAGFLRAVRGTHEVIVTILMNFIAAALTSYITLYLFKNPDSQNPETVAVGDLTRLDQWEWAGGAPLTHSLIIAIVSAIIIHVLVYRHRYGFWLRATGENVTAARVSGGIPTRRVQWWSLAVGGALAGLVALPCVLGQSGKFLIGFSPGFGFVGIAVALLGGGRPLPVIFGALLFGALTKGALDLDLETERVTRDVSLVLQALVIWIASSKIGLKRGRS